ncbi:hypothetical protein NQ318_000978 [Aromia moschata]|uniref:RRM domain-containing protein n=1 Tax=Aromia moschata TaxID=1265417 RepID=A0AAV8ZF74_9CUCU|nr:hypothetical protein NQ318_000978 [Aromia moschata]
MIKKSIGRDYLKMSEEDEPMDINDQNDSSSSSDEEEQELTNRAEQLERELDSNKYLYDAHVEIVQVYRKLSDLNSMRAAYQRFHECYPLTPKLWLEWLRDEIRIANTTEEQKRLFSLFDKAVDDYLSVELWVEYAQYSIGLSNLETTRSILERGLTSAGLHASEGSLLWDTLRELENAHISLKDTNSDEWKTQVKRLADVFKRQLSVPLIGMESTYHEWKEWFKSLPEEIVDPEPVEWAYHNASKTLEAYKPFEERLLIAESNEEIYDVYKEYVKSVKDPSTVLCLYERAATTLCLVPSLWLDYCMYAFNLGESALKINGRALRNCPWSEELWITRLRVLEKLGKPEKDVLTCFEQGTSSISPAPGLELWLSYLENVRRTSEDAEKLDKLFSQAIQQLGFENDPLCKLNRWHARLLAKRGDMPAARKIWNSILHQTSNKSTASVWLEYASLERQYGDASHLRSLFQRALKACTDWPQCLCEEWLMFEREEGTLEDILKCTAKIKTVVTIPTQSYTQNETNDANSDNQQKGKKRKTDTHDNKGIKSKRSKSDGSEEQQRPNKKDEPHFAKDKHITKDPKLTVFVSNLHPSVGEEKLKELFPNAALIELVKDRKGKSRCYGFIQFSKEEEAMSALASDRTPLDGRPVFISEIKPDKSERKPEFKYAVTTETNKLFVRGLPKTKTQEEVKEIFKAYDPTDVRLVLHKNGQPKGLAYVEFADDATAKRALQATDQMKVDDSVISVAISAPPGKKQQGVRQQVSEPLRHARSRLQVPLIPRSLQVKSGESKEKQTSNGSSASNEAPKSNADFRKMLLNK